MKEYEHFDHIIEVERQIEIKKPLGCVPWVIGFFLAMVLVIALLGTPEEKMGLAMWIIVIIIAGGIGWILDSMDS